MIRTAVVAYGFSSKTFHIPYLLTEPEFHWSHIVTSKVASVRMEFPDVSVVGTVDELDADQIDLVIITSPNSAHFTQVRYFLEKDCHVVIEKPFVLNSENAVYLKDLAEQRKKRLIVFQNRRWDGDFLTIRSLIETKRIGSVKRLISRFDRFRPVVRDRWREAPGDGAGILWDLGPHLIDQAIALFGKPKSISANVGCLRENAQVDDVFDITLEFDDIEVQVGSTCFQAGPNSRFILEGTEGTFVKYGLDVQEDALKQGADILDDRWGHESEECWGILYAEDSNKMIATKPGSYGVFWHQVAACISGGGDSPVPIDDSLLCIRLIELAHESSLSGRRLTVE